MSIVVVTGISGSGRIELLRELADYATAERGEAVVVHDVGALIANECSRLRIPITDQKMLDVDRHLRELLRSNALRIVENKILRNSDALHFVGVHATFRWKSRLIPGISYPDLVVLKPDLFINVVRNAADISETNHRNPKWDDGEVPDLRETQAWMMEEEFATEILADVSGKPVFIVARDHNISNLADLFFTSKKRIYLSYPITAVRQDNPQLLDQIQGPILKELEKLFVVFNPLSIKDMLLTYDDTNNAFPELVDQLTPEAKELVKTRTIERDYQFIDQSDAVVVFYLTEKLSPGVLGEMYYAHRTQKHVFMCFPKGISPFLDDVTDIIKTAPEELLKWLKGFAQVDSDAV